MPLFDNVPAEWSTYVQWLIIGCMWITLALGTWREDRKIRLLHKTPLNSSEIIALLQVLHQRHIQIGIVVTLLLAVVAVNDLRHGTEPTASTAPVIASVPAPAVSANATSSPTIKSPPSPSPPALVSTQLPFTDITEFNEQNSKEQAYLDLLKQRYEAWFVTYFYLSKCNLVGAQDMNLIQQSLQSELDKVHAAPKIRDNIMLAATGSFKEMYGDIPCDNSHILLTKSAYDANMQQLRHLLSSTVGVKDINSLTNTH